MWNNPFNTLENYLLEMLPYLLHATTISGPSCEFIPEESCRPKTYVLWCTGIYLSICGARQISSHSTSNNTPQWSQITCTMLQWVFGSDKVNIKQIIPSGRATLLPARIRRILPHPSINQRLVSASSFHAPIPVRCGKFNHRLCCYTS